MPVGGICVMAAVVKLLENDGGPVRLSEIYCNASVTSHEIVNISTYFLLKNLPDDPALPPLHGGGCIDGGF